MNRKDFLFRLGVPLLPLPVAAVGRAADATPDAGAPSFSGLPWLNVRSHGAKGDGQTKDTRAIQAAIDAAGQTGGMVCLPPGRYLSGTLRLRSHVGFWLDPGATLVASPDQADFDPYEKLSFKPVDDEETTYFNYALLRGEDLEHVSIFGAGTIEGNRRKRGGPKPIALKNCRHVAVRDLTIQNAPNYNVSLLGCDYVDIQGVTIRNGYCDGIDPDCCRFVRIANCYVESWDDAIVPKASFALGVRRSTEHLTVTNCVLTTACNAFKLGTEASGDFKNIVLSNCAIFAREDLWKRRPTSGVSIEMVDGAVIDRVVVANLALADVQAPIFIRLGNRGRAQATPTPGQLQHVSIADICATGASLASSITGIPGYDVRRVTLKNVRVSARGGGTPEMARKEVPELEGKYPDAGMFGGLPAYGLFCRHVEGLELDSVKFHLEAPDARPAVVITQASNLDLRNLTADPPSGEEPVISLRDVRDALLRGCRAQKGTKCFVHLSGAQTAQLRALGNDFSQATVPFRLDEDVPRQTAREEANLKPAP